MQTPELTSEQETTLREVFAYTDKADISDAEIELARQMFDSPEKFVLLRKILGVITQEERGIHYEGELSGLAANSFEEMGIEATIKKNVDARIKMGITSLYNLLRGTLQNEARAEMEKANSEKMDKEESIQQKNEEDAETNRPGGVNL